MLLFPAVANQTSGGGSNGLLTNLVSYWKLDEASGTRVDVHSTNDLTDNNTVTSATGKINNAASFDVTNIEYLSNANELVTANFSFSCWINPSSANNDDYSIFSQWGDTSKRAIWCWLDDVGATYTDTIAFGIWNQSDTLLRVEAGNSAVTTGTEYHVAGTCDFDGSLRLYINGSEVGNSPLDISSSTSLYSLTTAEFAIGSAYNSSRKTFDGWIDEFGLWSRALSTDDISALYASGSALAYSSFD